MDLDPNRPLTLKEAAGPLFGTGYQRLRNRLKAMLAEGYPFFKEGKHWMIYPKHLEAFRLSRSILPDAKRHLRQGGSLCIDAGKMANHTETGISTTR